MRASIFSAILAGLCALAAPALAQPYGAADRAPSDRDGVQPLDRLLPGIRRQHPGNFYDAEGPTYGPSGDPHYHLKWMTPDGRVIWYDTDARSGRVLRSSPGRDSFDSDRYHGAPPPERRFAPGGFGDRGSFGGAPYSYGGPRFAPRFAPHSGGGWGGWRGGGGGRWRH